MFNTLFVLTNREHKSEDKHVYFHHHDHNLSDTSPHTGWANYLLLYMRVTNALYGQV